MQRQRRFKQTVSLQDRIAGFSEKLHKEADSKPDGLAKQDLLKRVHAAEMAAKLDRELS